MRAGNSSSPEVGVEHERWVRSLVIATSFRGWCISEDSNLDPDRYERPALPVELEMRDVTELATCTGI